ncbi:MAG: gluconokinase [Deltaproteobacteria bacterium]|nr:gluconokinase [Deltaproteobacteria bacterium]
MSSMIDDLLNPAYLPDETEQVSLVQTHISMVIIADQFVYKIKKPVDFGFLDFTTLDKRYYYCNQEITLNRRLSRGLYLGVVPVVHDGTHYRMGQGQGRVVEYAVKMRRLPEEMLMKSVFLRGELSEGQLQRIADVLAGFHGSALHSPEIDAFGDPEAFKVNTDENFSQTEKYIGTTIRKEDFNELKRWTSSCYTSLRSAFLGRVRDKRIRDCHGDLHMEHICLTKDIPIFDCIEFNDRFRYTDTLNDIAFLLMDLEYHGGNRHSTILWDFYREHAQERDVEPILAFYKVYRAYVRGKVTSFQLDDERIEPGKKEEAVETARRYFQLARSYL